MSLYAMVAAHRDDHTLIYICLLACTWLSCPDSYRNASFCYHAFRYKSVTALTARNRTVTLGWGSLNTHAVTPHQIYRPMDMYVGGSEWNRSDKNCKETRR